MTTLKPVARRALLAAFASQGHTLRRTRGGFVSTPAQVKTSTAVQVEVFTRRAINWLYCEPKSRMTIMFPISNHQMKSCYRPWM